MNRRGQVREVKPRSRGHWLQVGSNVVVIVAVGVVLLRPTGPVTSWVREAIERHRVQDVLEREWEEFANVTTIDGSTGANLLVFVDYQCPFCRQLDELLREERINGVAVRHFPLEGIHEHARVAASLAICGEEQGLLSEMHLWLFNEVNWSEIDSVSSLNIDIPRLDQARLDWCLKSQEVSDRLAADSAWASRLQVRGTPTIVGKGGVITGVPTAEEMMELIR